MFFGDVFSLLAEQQLLLGVLCSLVLAFLLIGLNNFEALVIFDVLANRTSLFFRLLFVELGVIEQYLFEESGCLFSKWQFLFNILSSLLLVFSGSLRGFVSAGLLFQFLDLILEVLFVLFDFDEVNPDHKAFWFIVGLLEEEISLVFRSVFKLGFMEIHLLATLEWREIFIFLESFCPLKVVVKLKIILFKFFTQIILLLSIQELLIYFYFHNFFLLLLLGSGNNILFLFSLNLIVIRMHYSSYTFLLIGVDLIIVISYV